MKKILLGLGSIAAVSVPIGLVISCGDKAPPIHFGATLNGDVLIVNGFGITQVSSVESPNEFHMSVDNAAEIVGRLEQLGEEKYKKVKKIFLTIDGVTLSSSEVAVSITEKIDENKRKGLSRKFTNLILTKK